MSNKKTYKNKNVMGYVLAVIASVSFIIAAIVISVEINISNNDAFMKEYELCGVADTLGMEMEDIEYVSQEMMKSLRTEGRISSLYENVGSGERFLQSKRKRSYGGCKESSKQCSDSSDHMPCNMLCGSSCPAFI